MYWRILGSIWESLELLLPWCLLSRKDGKNKEPKSEESKELKPTLYHKAFTLGTVSHLLLPFHSLTFLLLSSHLQLRDSSCQFCHFQGLWINWKLVRAEPSGSQDLGIFNPSSTGEPIGNLLFHLLAVLEALFTTPPPGWLEDHPILRFTILFNSKSFC